jgi:hypothetical protein
MQAAAKHQGEGRRNCQPERRDPLKRYDQQNYATLWK